MSTARRKRRVYFTDDCVLIPLANCKGVAVVDIDDATAVVSSSWSLTNRYAGACINKKTVRLHTLLLRLPDGLEADHANRDRLDNRRKNLRAARRQQNAANSSIKKNNRSGVKGVAWNKAVGKWQANVSFNGKNHYLGIFEDKQEAARAYRAAARELFGAFASTGR